MSITQYGPRKLTLSKIRQPKVNPRLRAPNPDGASDPPPDVTKGNIRLNSSSTPGLKSGLEYTVTFSQKITIDGQEQIPFESFKSFTTISSGLTLDPGLVDSVYPPPGHADYWNVLPHVVFNDPKIPWMHPLSDSASSSDPWVALLVFTEDEINPSLFSPAFPLPEEFQVTPTFSYCATASQLFAIKDKVNQAVPTISETDTTAIETIFVQQSLFAKLFTKTTTSSDPVPSADVFTPGVDRFKLMSHVRTYDPSGTAGQISSLPQKVAVTVTPRTGKPQLTVPTSAYAHLVSLIGIDGQSFNTGNPIALVSLYSWSFNYIPPNAFSARHSLENLGAPGNIQPLRVSDAALANVNTAYQKSSRSLTDTDQWVQNKKLSGYSLIRYQTPTGECSTALQRGFLTPVKFDAFDWPPSDYGSDLATIDEKSGLLDITFQLAWELGRTSALADRSFSGSLMRLRKDAHQTALNISKAKLDATHIAAEDSIGAYQKSFAALMNRRATDSAQRWETPSIGKSKRESLAFVADPVQQQYQSELADGVGKLADAVTSANSQAFERQRSASYPIYDESNSPQSTDYALILKWIMDHWSLNGLPFHYLVPDPEYIPKETVRTFYVDTNWFKVFVDGALSVGEHFDNADVIRESIKKSLSNYLGRNVGNTGFPPQIPKWGFFIRSEFVTKYPGLRISAPFADPDKAKSLCEVLVLQRLDTDLLLVLFDREPDEFDQAIAISPPEHQLSSMFGDADGLTADNELNIVWKNVFSDMSKGFDRDEYAVHETLYDIFNLSPAIYDISCQAINPGILLRQANSSLPGLAAKYEEAPSLLGAQLIAMVPNLTLARPSSTARAQTLAEPKVLTTSKPRAAQAASLPSSSTPITDASVLKPSAIVNTSSISNIDKNPALKPDATPSALIIQDIQRAIAQTDVQTNFNANTVSTLFTYPNFPYSQPSVWPPRNNTLLQAVPSSSTPPRTIYTVLGTSVYNLRYNTNSSNGRQQALVALYPLSLGFKTDVHIDNLCLTSGYTGTLRYVTIILTVGTNLDGPNLLAPFPNNRTSQSAQRNSIGEWPLQPDHTGALVSGIVLPNVRLKTPGRRWNIQTSYTPNANPGTSNFNIKLIPNTAQSTCTLKTGQDLSVVIENVQINCIESVNLGRGIVNSRYDFISQVAETYIDQQSKTDWTIYGGIKGATFGIDARQT